MRAFPIFSILNMCVLKYWAYIMSDLNGFPKGPFFLSVRNNRQLRGMRYIPQLQPLNMEKMLRELELELRRV